MALEITKTTQYGNNATYWRVVETNVNWIRDDSHVTLAGYISSKERNAGNAPIATVNLDWPSEDNPFVLSELDKANTNTISVAYKKIKTLDEWKDAKDV